MEDIKSLWGKILSKLELVTSTVSFELWIKPLEVLEYRDNKVLVIVASTTTAKNQIIRNHLRQITDIVKQVYDENTEIEIIDQDEKEQYLKKYKPNAQGDFVFKSDENDFS